MPFSVFSEVPVVTDVSTAATWALNRTFKFNRFRRLPGTARLPHIPHRHFPRLSILALRVAPSFLISLRQKLAGSLRTSARLDHDLADYPDGEGNNNRSECEQKRQTEPNRMRQRSDRDSGQEDDEQA